MKNSPTRAGFTLIELLVVISIISLLSSVVLASLNNVRAKARDARRLADMVTIRNIVNLYAANNNGTFPGVVSGNVNGDYWTSANSINGGGSNQWSAFVTLVGQQLPTDPLLNCTGSSDQNSQPCSGNRYYEYFQNWPTGTAAPGNCFGHTILRFQFELATPIQQCNEQYLGQSSTFLVN